MAQLSDFLGGNDFGHNLAMARQRGIPAFFGGGDKRRKSRA